MVRKIVTLTSDFGGDSPYASAMRGVILSRCEDVIIHDVCHAVPAFDVLAGAYVVWVGTSTYPATSVHVVVVDPGVGSDRGRLIASADGAYYVAPDNGVLSYVLARSRRVQAWIVDDPIWFGEHVSPTFEGRDVFAWLAAHLINGRSPQDMGAPLARPQVLTSAFVQATSDGSARGRVIWIDGLGNLVTNLTPPFGDQSWQLLVGGRWRAPHARTYSDVGRGEALAYEGSMGLIEIGIRDGNAAQTLGLSLGSEVTLLP